MTKNTRESLLICSGVFVLTASSIEALRWFGWLQEIAPVLRTAVAAGSGVAAFLLTYYLRRKSGEAKPRQD